jgi:hypothetical protein
MEEDLRKALCAYRDCTLQVIEILKNDEFDLLDQMVEKRQALTDLILETKCEKAKAKAIYDEFQLQKLQNKINELMLKKMSLIKSNIENISRNKAANNAYIRNNGAKIFSLKR